MRILKIICLLILTIVGAFFLVEGGLFFRAAATDVPALHDALVSVRNIESATVATEGQSAGLLDDVDTFVRGWQAQQSSQLQAIQRVADKASVVLDSTNTSIEHIDGVITEIADVVPIVKQSVVDVDTAIKDIQPGIVDLDKAAANAADVLASPDIPVAINHFTNTAANLDATTSKVRDGVTYEVDQLMKPVRKVKAVALFLTSIAGKFFGY